MDGHGVLGLCAPRACAIATGHQDKESDITFANEMNVAEASKVFKLLGVPGNLGLIYRTGDHHGYDDVHTYFDWFDMAFGRPYPRNAHPVQHATHYGDAFLTPAGFDWNAWNALAGGPRAPPAASAPLRDRVGWLLSYGGAQSKGGARYGPAAGYGKGAVYCEEWPYISTLMHHDVSLSW